MNAFFTALRATPRTRGRLEASRLALVLLIAAVLGPPVLPADARALPAALVQAYRERLDLIQSGGDRLADLLPCLETHAASLQSRSEELEIALGMARRRETPLLAVVDRLQSEQAGFEAEIESQRPALEEKRQSYQNIAETVRKQKKRLETCHLVLFLSPGTCDLGELIAKGLGLMESLDAEIRIAETVLLNAERGRRETTDRLRATEGQLTDAQTEVATLKTETELLESRIARIKKTQADINVATQTHLTLLDDFETALDVEPLNTATNSVRAVLAAIERLTVEQRRIIAMADAELPEDVKRECKWI